MKEIIMLTSSGGGEGAADPIAKFFNIILEIIAPLANQITVIAMIVIMICGFMFAVPGAKRLKEKAGGWLIGLIIGAILMAGASQYASYLYGKITF